MKTVESVLVDKGFGFARDEHLVVMVYAGPHSSEFADITIEQSRLAGLTGKKTAIILYLSGDAGTPDSKSRRKYAVVMEDHAKHAHGLAYVVPGKGFGAAAQRSVITGIGMLFATKMKTHVVKELEDAGDWFSRLGLSDKDVRRLLDLTRELVAALERTSR